MAEITKNTGKKDEKKEESSLCSCWTKMSLMMMIKKEVDFVIISLNTQAVFSKIITLFPAKIKEVFLLYQYPAGGVI